ncbi:MULTISPECIES: metallophosphoesterase family protein [Streptomyces]|uniref:Metallophosphoesterase n=1 Tax=Streptomyces tsukubensis (strain DSM 42081 / NBRC 108919 / NRRL 18488 / 9993) TaxID=1114943 RepID=I2N7R7_STRT9|nr:MULTISPECIES: metallophosphoesterase [Streptomyces]AZK96960.1 metallophosphoesterase [Streptomyces tsukubensis]EIF93064.1 SimX4-like protein [Streptomyces tsukubensis NRRL18488]MYS66445.1 metallophosphoesterase [Streptomyces sp. SID5473]QKM67059.1 metallophosphoesterase [Streptomyces tsukubensis NRRL18488]TAI41460.1 metallophosphoesterase [Streptomyces tsukubensis]
MRETRPGKLLAISDLHVHYEENRKIADGLRPGSDEDWLIVAGDVGEIVSEVERTLRTLRDRFAKVVWAPGNHELWTAPEDPVRLRGEERYRHLVEICRGLGVATPEDPYPVWEGEGGPVAVAPLFLLYDYSFRPDGTYTKEAALEQAERAGVICTDEFMLHPDPYPSREAWCRARVRWTEARLAELPDELPTVLVNHFPLVREPTRVLWHPEFALWCGTTATADWHVRFRARSVVYGHLHIPRTIRVDGVPHQEVSLGYPREWRRRTGRPGQLVQILPAAAPVAAAGTGLRA